MLAMVGLKERQGNMFTVTLGGRGTREIAGKASVCPKTIEALGGKLQALKLLRHCEMAKMLCKEDETTFGIIAASFERVVIEFPLLRSYYEMAKIGAAPHSWYRTRSHVS